MSSEDFTARNEYYRKARICPHCGNDDKVAESEHPFGGVRMMRYVCLKCGWNWEVESYHEENEGTEAAEEKFADRPQIQVGDIVRFISGITGEENVEVVRCENPEAYFNLVGEILAVYRFDGLDFNCIWERRTGWLNGFKNSLLALRKSTKEFNDATKALLAAIKKSNTDAGEKND